MVNKSPMPTEEALVGVNKPPVPTEDVDDLEEDEERVEEAGTEKPIDFQLFFVTLKGWTVRYSDTIFCALETKMDGKLASSFGLRDRRAARGASASRSRWSLCCSLE